MSYPIHDYTMEGVEPLTCYRCKRKNPECGFYPMLWQGGLNFETGKVEGGLLCKDCDKEMRNDVS